MLGLNIKLYCVFRRNNQRKPFFLWMRKDFIDTLKEK